MTPCGAYDAIVKTKGGEIYVGYLVETRFQGNNINKIVLENAWEITPLTRESIITKYGNLMDKTQPTHRFSKKWFDSMIPSLELQAKESDYVRIGDVGDLEKEIDEFLRQIY